MGWTEAAESCSQPLPPSPSCPPTSPGVTSNTGAGPCSAPCRGGGHAQAVDGNSSPSGALGTKPRARALCLGQRGCRGVRGGAVGCEQAAGRRPRDRVLWEGREAEVTLRELLLPSWKIFQLWVFAGPFCSLSYGESRACYALPPPPRTKWQPGGTGGGCHSPPAAPGSSVHLSLWLGSPRNPRLGKWGRAAPPRTTCQPGGSGHGPLGARLEGQITGTGLWGLWWATGDWGASVHSQDLQTGGAFEIWEPLDVRGTIQRSGDRAPGAEGGSALRDPHTQGPHLLGTPSFPDLPPVTPVAQALVEAGRLAGSKLPFPRSAPPSLARTEPVTWPPATWPPSHAGPVRTKHRQGPWDSPRLKGNGLSASGKVFVCWGCSLEPGSGSPLSVTCRGFPQWSPHLGGPRGPARDRSPAGWVPPDPEEDPGLGPERESLGSSDETYAWRQPQG